jgi:rhamnose utilization protein RhaD (predicted bifunctional aldolase and dehydrogenase)
MLLMSYSSFSYGEMAKVSYKFMVELVGRAEEYLAKHNA